MPTYSYKCTSPTCGRTQDVRHGFTESGPTECPCGGALRKVFAAPAIEFKGSGFYRTDSRR